MDLNKKASKLFLICVILFLGLSVLLGLFQGMDPNAFYLLNSLAVSIPAFLIPAIIFRRKYKLPRSGAPTAAMALLAIGIGVGCIFMNQSLSYLTEAIFGEIRVVSNSTTSETIMGLDLWVMVIALAIVPPVSEELIMRGTLLECWRRYSPAGALVLTSVLFGLLHAAPTSLIIYMGLGLLLGCVYLITRNFWLCMIIHLINNLVSVIGAVIMQQYSGAEVEEAYEAASWLSNTAAPYIILFVLSGIMAAAIIIPLMILLKNHCMKNGLGMYSEAARSEAERSEAELLKAEGKAAPSLLRDPVLWAAILLLVLINIFSGLIEFGVIAL